MSDEESSAPAAEKEEKEEEKEEKEEKEEREDGGKEEEAEKGDEDGEKEPENVTNADVFGDDDDDDDDKPAEKSKKGDDSDASKGGGSDSDEPQQLKKKGRKKLTRTAASDDSDAEEEDEPAPQKKKKEKEKKEKGKKKKSKRRRGDESEENSDKEADNVKAFLDSDDGEAMSGNEDEEEAEQIAKEGGLKKKLTKSDKQKIQNKEKEYIERFVVELKKAAFADKDSYKKKETATRKMSMLEELKRELSVHRKHALYLEAGVLKSLKLWLDPLDDQKRVSSLPNRKLIADVVELLLGLPIDEDHQNVAIGTSSDRKDYLDYVTESEVGHAVMFIKKALSKDGKNTAAYRAATQVIQKWARLIFKKSGDYKKNIDRDDDDDDEEERRKRTMPKANRDWEQMPDNKDREGRKFTKGDFGFRYGASVPRPMLVDFQKMPESKVDTELKIESAKERVNAVRDRLFKVGVESKRGMTDGRNTRAEAPELNRMHVGGVAEKVCSMGWAERAPKKSKSK